MQEAPHCSHARSVPLQFSAPDTRDTSLVAFSIRDEVEGVTPMAEVSHGSPTFTGVASPNWRWRSDESASEGKPSEGRREQTSIIKGNAQVCPEDGVSICECGIKFPFQSSNLCTQGVGLVQNGIGTQGGFISSTGSSLKGGMPSWNHTRLVFRRIG